ncbi:restriction endonuclease subunit S [Sphaerospermopsis sp. FACHB-1094]|uniref:restriction endonuclease subunit S n=1 Tax=Sphaerospermopsis sp. FACHB-1094 TaxID=2692861 RepID=UPI0016899F23|nr:restriction endonuclease subunit S [Sphaerospermopsis sp. FACHB-1094]MBD2134149.1 restriction endonuclease subunit S [Sphaerospermopsis sp. FACHB-1094]
MGDVPEHWEVIRIKFSTYVKGRVGWHGLNSKEFLYEGDFYLVTGTDFKGRTINWESCYRITEERYEEDPYIHLKENDILITKDGTIGKVVQVKNIPYKASVNSGVFVTRPLKNKPYKDDYMFYVLNSNIFHEFIDIQKSGTTISHLYQNVFENFEYPFPPLDEQEKIARFLDYKTKQIDDLIAKKETLIEKLDEKRTSLISHAVTKGLDVNVPMKDSGIEWLGEIPKHWEISKAKFVSRIFVPQRNKPDLNLDDGFSWLTMDDMLSDTVTNTTFKVTKEAAQNAGSRVLKKGSVVASCVGNFGVCAVINVDVIINQQLQAFIPDKNIIPEFLREIVKISKDYFQMIATAATVVYVNQSGFANMPIILPPKEEQEKIINYIAITKEKLEEQKTKIQQAIDLLKEYRTALITNAVTGKIDVRKITIPKI